MASRSDYKSYSKHAINFSQVLVKTSRGIVNRPVQKLHDLEITASDSWIQSMLSDKTIDISNPNDNLSNDIDDNVIVSRAGRVSKPPARYGS